MDIERNVKQASEDVENFLNFGSFVVDPDASMQRAIAPRASRRDFKAYFSRWENLKVLIGTCWSWFALDIAFFGLGLNNVFIFTAIGFGSPSTGAITPSSAFEALKNACIANIIVSVAGLIPGYYAAMILIDK